MRFTSGILCSIFFCGLALTSFGQTNKLVLPLGHSDLVYSAVYSPVTESDPLGGKFILTSSADRSMILWNAGDGKFITSYRFPAAGFVYASFTPDGQQIIAATDDSTVRVWDVLSGTIISELKGFTDAISQFSISPKYGVAGRDKLLIVVYKNQGAVARKMDEPGFSMPLETTKRIRTVSFSADGRNFITTAFDDVEAHIYSVSKFTIDDALKIPGEQINTAVYSKDGLAIFTSDTGDKLIKWDALSRKKLFEVDSLAEVVDIASSDDNKWIATSNPESIIHVLDAGTGKKLQRWQSDEEAFFKGKNQLSFDPQGQHLLLLNGLKSIKTWLPLEAEPVASFGSHTSLVREIGFSPSGKIMYSIHEDGSLRTWNGQTGKLLGSSERDSRYSAMAFSPDNTSLGSKYVAYIINKITAFFQLRTRDAEKQYLLGHTGYINSIVFSPEGNELATASNDGTAIVWKTVPRGNAAILSRFRHNGIVTAANFSPDGKRLVTSSYDKTVIVWNIADSSIVKKITGFKAEVADARFSNDGKLLLTTCFDNSVQIWDARNFQPVSTIYDESAIILSARFAPIMNNSNFSQPLVITAGPGNDAVLWDALTGVKLRTFTGHTAVVNSAVISPNGNYVVTASDDNFCKVWDIASGSLVYNFIAIDRSDYLVTDSLGRFDGTASAIKRIHITCGIQPVELDQFKDIAWEPNLSAKLLQSNAEPITAKSLDLVSICNVSPEVITLPPQNGMYRFRVKARAGGLGNLELFVNDKLIKTLDSSHITSSDDGYLATISQQEVETYFIAGQVNRVELNANTKTGDISARGVTLLSRPTASLKTAPNLYILSIGISNYRGEKLRLNYAAKDAVDFSKTMDAAAKNLLNVDGKEHVFSYTLNTDMEDVTKWPSKQIIFQSIDSIAAKALPTDIFIVFFAGHGVLPDEKKSLYLLTAEATSFELDEKTEKLVSISTNELIEWMKKIKAGKQVFILDACNSGQVIESLQKFASSRGEIPADQQRALQNLQDKSGTFILSASASNQSAYESGVYNQGLLTYGLLSGLKLGDGLNATNYIDLSQWFNSTVNKVGELAEQIGGRQKPQILGNASFEVGLVTEKLKREIILPNKKAIFGSTLFIGNINNLDDSLSLSEAMNKELDNRSVAGKESLLAYAPNSKLPETWYIRGRYSIKGNTMSVLFGLFKDKQKEKDFSMNFPVTQIDQIPVAIANELEKYMASQKKPTANAAGNLF